MTQNQLVNVPPKQALVYKHNVTVYEQMNIRSMRIVPNGMMLLLFTGETGLVRPHTK